MYRNSVKIIVFRIYFCTPNQLTATSFTFKRCHTTWHPPINSRHYLLTAHITIYVHSRARKRKASAHVTWSRDVVPRHSAGPPRVELVLNPAPVLHYNCRSNLHWNMINQSMYVHVRAQVLAIENICTASRFFIRICLSVCQQSDRHWRIKIILTFHWLCIQFNSSLIVQITSCTKLLIYGIGKPSLVLHTGLTKVVIIIFQVAS